MRTKSVKVSSGGKLRGIFHSIPSGVVEFGIERGVMEHWNIPQKSGFSPLRALLPKLAKKRALFIEYFASLQSNGEPELFLDKINKNVGMPPKFDPCPQNRPLNSIQYQVPFRSIPQVMEWNVVGMEYSISFQFQVEIPDGILYL